MSEQALRRFYTFFRHQTGIAFTPAKRYYVESRLRARLIASGQDGVEAYLAHLKTPAGTAELEQLINLLTINETFFYRETRQFEALTQSVLPELAALRGPGGVRRLLCMPCATGEEPYSIALHLLAHGLDPVRHHIELHGADIDTDALRAAKAGLYDDETLRHLPGPLRARYFTRQPDGRHQISPAVRACVQFAHANITRTQDMQRYREIDVLFCRNLLIYFDEAARRHSVRILRECLRPGGFIFLGHSESMRHMADLFLTRHFGAVIAYQKPGDVP